MKKPKPTGLPDFDCFLVRTPPGLSRSTNTDFLALAITLGCTKYSSEDINSWTVTATQDGAWVCSVRQCVGQHLGIHVWRPGHPGVS